MRKTSGPIRHFDSAGRASQGDSFVSEEEPQRSNPAGPVERRETLCYPGYPGRTLECSGTHIRRLCVSGKLRHFRIGSLYRISVDAVLDYEAGHYGEEKPAPAAAVPITPTALPASDKEDPVATYVRSFRERMATQPAGHHDPLSYRPDGKED